MIKESEVSAVSKGQQNWVLAATILGSSIAFINGSTVNVALPDMQSDLGATVTDIQWILNSYTLFLAALILLGGSLGDHFGRKRIFTLGVVIFGAASIWCGLAPTATQLIIARAVQGIGGALLTPGSLAIISASFPSNRRGWAIGVWSGFSTLTSAVGPLLGGWLIDTVGWRWIFFMLIPLCVAVIAITLRYVPESRDDEATGRLDWLGSFLVTAGLGSLTYGFIESNNLGLGAPLVLGTIAAGVVLLGLFVVAEARQKTPIVPLNLFQSRSFSGTNLLTLLLYTGLGAVSFFLPLNLIQVQGYSATEAGAAMLPMVILMFVLSGWAGNLVERVGAKLPLVIGPLLAAAGFFLFSLPGIGGSYWTTFFPAVLALGLGMSITVAPLTTTVMNAVPSHFSGTASGINNAVARVANLLAIAVLGVVVVGAFGQSLSQQLAPLELPDIARTTILAAQGQLAELPVPTTLPNNTQEAVQTAIHESFIQSFRLMAWISTGLALASAAVAWVLVEGKDGEKSRAD
jgi:EmrB/QacA subfamily drug resistance transporter